MMWWSQYETLNLHINIPTVRPDPDEVFEDDADKICCVMRSKNHMNMTQNLALHTPIREVDCGEKCDPGKRLNHKLMETRNLT